MDQESNIAPYKHDKVGDWVFQTPWTKEEIELAIELFKQGKSQTEIGKKLHRSANSVAGKINRSRKSGVDFPRRVIEYKKKKEPVAAKPKKAARKEPPKVVEAPPPPIEKVKRVRLKLIDSDTAVTFAELEHHHCRYPMGDPRQSDFRFCGCNRLVGKPYCEAHAVIAGRQYVPSSRVGLPPHTRK